MTNFLQWRTNYLIACLSVVVLSLVTSPALIMVLLLCAGMWFYVMVVKSGPIVVGENEYGGLHRHRFATPRHPNGPPPPPCTTAPRLYRHQTNRRRRLRAAGRRSCSSCSSVNFSRWVVGSE